jgi:DNA invertase Pin-like site-specific DNA recombinase
MTKRTPAVAYLRTSSLTNVGGDKDSARRQAEAMQTYANAKGLTITVMFFDAGVSGADPVDERPGFCAMLDYMSGNGASVILVENASRFARDLAVQITGHDYLKGLGYDLIPADAPDHFTDETPTAVMVRQILGAVSQFEKATVVSRLRQARKRKRAETGRCEGRKPPPPKLVKEAKRLHRKSPKSGKRRSLRTISRELADLGHLSPIGKPYSAEGIRKLLNRAA